MAGKKSLPSAVGLDIGSSTIKVVEAKSGKGGPKISGIGIIPTPEGAVDNSVVLDPVAVGQAIKKLLSESGIKSKPVVSSVAGQSSVVVRVIEVPRMTRQELGETMKFEVERHVPFSPSDVVMDFAPLEKPNQPPDAQSMEVLLAVAQQDVVNTHVETLFAAGLAPKVIDVEPLASGRALLDSGTGPQNAIVAVADIGASKTEVGIFESGLLTFACPPLMLAGTAFTRAISEYLQVPMDEAEGLKKRLAMVDMSKLSGVTTAPTGGQDWDQPFGAHDAASDQTIAGSASPFDAPSTSGASTAPDASSTFDLESEPVPDQPVSGFGSAFDFGGGTGEPKPTAQQDPGDVYDLGGDESQAEVRPVFDMGDEPVAAAPTADQAQQSAGDAGAFDLDSAGDEHAEPAHPALLQPVVLGAEAETKERVCEAITHVLLDLAAEIRASLGYYQSKYGVMPDKMLLTGGTANLPGLDKFLESELGMHVEKADPFANFSVSSARYSDQYLKEISPLFSVSVGLAVREMLPD
jgi:type IV pilus assembly protein PilM